MDSRERELRDVLAEHGPMLRRIVASYERDPSLQADLLQEVALALWTALPRFKGEGSKRSYVARVAQNRAITHSVRRSKEPRLNETEVEDRGPAIDHQVDIERQASRVLELVRSLRLEQRRLVVLALEGFSTKEIAAELGISENNASVRLHRARAELKKRLSRWPRRKTGTS